MTKHLKKPNMSDDRRPKSCISGEELLARKNDMKSTETKEMQKLPSADGKSFLQFHICLGICISLKNVIIEL